MPRKSNTRNAQGAGSIRQRSPDRWEARYTVGRDPATGKIVCRVQLFNPTLEQLAASVVGRISNRPLNPYIPGGLPGNTKPLAYPVDPQSIPDCVPYNVMGSGNMSQAAIDYVGTDKTNLGYVDQEFSEITTSGQLYKGWGAGPIGVAAGVTWRRQSFIDDALPLPLVDLGPPVNVPTLGIRGIPPGLALSTPGNLHLFSTVPYIAGKMSVWEGYVETNIPVWKTDKGQALDIDFAGRRSDYSRSGAVDAWKAGGNLDVVKDLRFRVTRSRDVREPSFSELFDAQASGSNVIDRAFNNESYLITSVRGGNPNLSPEVATTNTAGFVFQPSFFSWLDGLQISSDWYDVKIAGAVAQLGAQVIADQCNAGVTAECALITRGSDGRITYIFDQFQNVAGARARGVDTEVIWRAQPDFIPNVRENFNLRWLTGYVIERSDTPAGGTPVNTTGTATNPRISSTATANYSLDNWSVQLQARYVDRVKRSSTFVEGIDVDINSVASQTLFNGRIGYNGKLNGGTSWQLALNVQNMLNRDPPKYGGTGQIYDVFGRRYNLSLNLSF
jgi:outer membrane receptor protein involved in Fe transport